jgi:flagellar hook-length control protein FliK
MIISDQITNDLTASNSKVEGKTSNRFSQVLSRDAQRHREKEKHAKKKGRHGQSPIAGAALTDSDSIDKRPQSVVSSAAVMESNETSRASATELSQIEELANELGAHIESSKEATGARMLNITFDSKTLEGLNVQIRQQGQDISIHFVTQSAHISELLHRHTAKLRNTLTKKNAKVTEIRISNSFSRGTPQRKGYGIA